MTYGLCERGQLINAFIREELDHKETPAFLEHIRSCPKCYDDLEMNYLIHMALNELDGADADYSLGDAMDKALERADQKHRRRTAGRVALYVVGTLLIWVAAYMALHLVRDGVFGTLF